MVRFLARLGVLARFGSTDFGEVSRLDVGEYNDPDQFGAQYYVFSHDVRQGVVRFTSHAAEAPLLGTMAELVLRHQGAEYRAEAACTEAAPRADGRVAYVFEVQGQPRITASARERHGVDCLATALLLDALEQPE
ncbi:MAG: hypothetical protein JW940_08540 [Polyangiaceae bacterium]|nr:hypothetical protein [Polyangiaceae bacterium]